MPLVILTKKFEFLGRNVKAKGDQHFEDGVSGHEKGAADAVPLRLNSFACLKPRDMETLNALITAACKAEPLITAAADG